MPRSHRESAADFPTSARCFTRQALALLLWLGVACSPKDAPPPPAPPAQAQAVAPELQAGMQPKPGERVRQPFLDEHCDDNSSPVAFYYHGGRPFSQRALKDGCRPLYLLECAEDGKCSESREQETGMWCCADPAQHTEAHAERR